VVPYRQLHLSQIVSTFTTKGGKRNETVGTLCKRRALELCSYGSSSVRT